VALESAKILREKGKKVCVVSVPCYDLFCEQDKAYQQSIVNPLTKVVAIEAARGFEWYRFAQIVIGMESFGASGKDKALFDHFGFTPQKISTKILASF
jgi:transketolase